MHFIYVRRGPHLPPVYSRQTSDAPRHSASSLRETWRTACGCLWHGETAVNLSGVGRNDCSCMAFRIHGSTTGGYLEPCPSPFNQFLRISYSLSASKNIFSQSVNGKLQSSAVNQQHILPL